MAWPTLNAGDLEGVPTELVRRVNEIGAAVGRTQQLKVVPVTFQRGNQTTARNPLDGSASPLAVLVAQATEKGNPVALSGVAWTVSGAQLDISDVGGALDGHSYAVSLLVIGA